jgi:predicted transcriptional regulator
MSEPTSAQAADALEDIAYLTRSGNRVAVLDSLATGPHTPSELTDVIDASRPTLGRILNEFEERGWTERTDDGYVATPTGEHVVTEFSPFAGAMTAIRRLGDAVSWLPSDELTIGLHHFRDAVVRRPDRYDPMDTVDVVTELLRKATEFRTLTHLVPPRPKQKALLDGVVTGRLDAKLVVTDDLVGYLRDNPERDAWVREFVAEGARVYQYDDPIPCNLFVIDDLVLVGKSHPESGHPYAFIETENETVRTWARELIDEYCADADRIAPETSAGEEASAEEAPAERPSAE